MRSLRPATVASLAALTLIPSTWLGLLASGVPTPICPQPALIWLPALLLSGLRLQYAAIVFPAVSFCLWHRGLFRGDTIVPRRTYFLLAILFVLNLVWIVCGWRLGVQYEGVEYMRAVCFVSLIWATFLVYYLARTKRRGSTFAANLFLHWALFAWLGWYAFPYLGELL
jgi:cytochrome bd-type quinol oxidase subunit 2